MSKKANTTFIGLFVIGAVALVILSLIVLGAGKIYSEKTTFVTYFNSSIQGLRPGANVTFRGVRIGQVNNIYVQFDESMLEFVLPVVIEFQEGAIQTISGNDHRRTDAEVFEALIERGLRAKLQMESFVTGQLLIDLDFYPDQPAIFRDDNSGYPEIPTIPSDIQVAVESVQKIMKKLNEVPVDEILDNLSSTMEGIDKLVNSPEIYSAIEGVDKLVNSTETQQISARLIHSLDQLDATTSEIQLFVQNMDQQVTPIATEVEKAINDIQIAIGDMRRIFKEVREGVEDDMIRYELNTTLSELKNAARSFRIFVEYLEKHPEALIRGKPNSQ